MERDRVYGPGVFASSQLSILDTKGGESKLEKLEKAEKAPAGAGDAPAAPATTTTTITEDAYTQIRQVQTQPQAPVSAAAAPTSRKEAAQAQAQTQALNVPNATTPTTGKPDYSMPLPRLPVPESSHYSTASYDPTAAGAAGSGASPTTPTFNNHQNVGPQPRARDMGGQLPPGTPTSPHHHGHTPSIGGLQPQRRAPDGQVQGQGQDQGKEGQGGKLLPRVPRAPPAAGHRRSHSLSQRPTAAAAAAGVLGMGKGLGWGSVFGRNAPATPTATVHNPATGAGTDEMGIVGLGLQGVEGVPRTAGPEVTTFAEREREREEERHGGQGLVSGGATLVRRFGSLLIGSGGGSPGGGRSTHGASAGANNEEGRKSTSTNASAGGSVKRPAVVGAGDAIVEDEDRNAGGDTPTATVEEVEGDEEGSTSTPTPCVPATAPPITTTTPPTPTSPSPHARTLTSSVSQPIGSVHRRAATILDHHHHGRRGASGAGANTLSVGQGHDRRSSTGGPAHLIGVGVSSSAGAAVPSYTTTQGGATMTMTPGRVRRPSTGYAGRPGAALVERFFPTARGGEQVVLEGDNDDADVDAEEGEGEEEDKEHEEHEHGEKGYKPVYLKGLFSVATTSSKTPVVIKADIRRVLDRMQVQYREMRGGFECVHSPSIDVASVNVVGVEAGRSVGQYSLSGGGVGSGSGGEVGPSSPGKPSIVKKASKLSFGMKRDKGKEKEKEREKEREREEKEKGQVHLGDGPANAPLQVQGRPSGGTTTATATGLTATPSSGSSSFFNVASNQTVVAASNQQEQQQQQHLKDPSSGDQQGSIRSYSPVSNKSKVLPPIPRDFAGAGATGTVGTVGSAGSAPLPPRSPSPLPSGEVGREVFESIAKNQLSVRFEINIVKVPWLPLHGIQFRRTSGDGWQYQMLARRVLTELKL